MIYTLDYSTEDNRYYVMVYSDDEVYTSREDVLKEAIKRNDALYYEELGIDK